MNLIIRAVFLYLIFQMSHQIGFAQKAYGDVIDNFNEAYDEMYDQMDFSVVRQYYSDSIRIMPEFQETILSIENTDTYYQSFFQRFRVNSYNRNDYEILDLGSRLVVLGTFEISFKDSLGSYNLKGKYMNVWIEATEGDFKLFTEAWNYDHPVEFEDKLKFSNVPSIRMALEPHINISDNISFELAGLNALMEHVISEKDGRLWSMFYDDKGISLHSFEPMVIGRENLDAYYRKHAMEMPVFEKLDVRTDRIDELHDYVIEYATAIANWRINEYSGVSTSKNIRIWKRQSNGSLKIFRLIAMYDR